MAQNELQEMISRYQKELLQYARSANKPTTSQSAVSQSTASQSVTKAPTVQTQPTAQTRPIPSQPRSPQSAMPTFPRSTMPTPSQSSMQPPTPPLDEIDSGYMFDELDEMLPDELDDIERLLENESDVFLPDELDRYSDEELSGYFSAYPEDADDQTPFPNTYADTQPTASQSVTKKATNRPQPTEPPPTN